MVGSMSKHQYLLVLSILGWACGSSSGRVVDGNGGTAALTSMDGGTTALTSTGGVPNAAGTSANCPQGWLGCPCTPNKGCSADLICLSSADGSNTMCVRSESGGSSSVAGSAGAGGGSSLVGGESGLGGVGGLSAVSSSLGGAGSGGLQTSAGGLSTSPNTGSGNLGGSTSGGVASTSTECPVVSVPLQIPTDITLRSCTISLPALPPGSWWFVLAAADVSGQAVVFPVSQSDGWVYADHTATLVGPTCDKFKQGFYSDLRFVYTCQGGEIIVH
jgi:hypothetical protein